MTSGKRADSFYPPEFYKNQILTTMDHPLLLLSIDKHDNKWLFSWADSDEGNQETLNDSGIQDLWFALPISDERFYKLSNEEISLREAILFHEKELFLVTAKRPLLDAAKIINWKKLRDSEIPRQMLPVLDISIKGNKLIPPLLTEDGVTIEMHLFSSNSKVTDIPFQLVGPLMDYTQKIIRWASDFVQKGSPKEIFMPKNVGMRLERISPGSINIVSEAYSDEFEERHSVVKAISNMKEFIENPKMTKDLEKVENLLGIESLRNIYYLMRLIERENMNLNLKSVSESGQEYSLAISFNEAKRIARRLSSYFKKVDTSAGITIRLSDDAVDKLMSRRISGQGGYQSLALSLKKQIDPKTKTLVLSPQLTERVIRYAQLYGDGGWQGRLDPILQELRKLGVIFSDLR